MMPICVLSRRRRVLLSALFAVVALYGSGNILFAGSVTDVNVTVYIGESTVLQPTGGILSSPTQSDQETCRAEQLSGVFLVLTGVRLGKSTVTIASTDATPNATVYRVSVERNPNIYRELQSAIQQQFPGSNIQLVLVPSSDKIIIQGTATSDCMVQQIIAFVESRNLSRAQLLQRIAVPCCCTCCYGRRR